MATDYTLQLKAILNTTQVKQELEKLRQLQKQVGTVNSGSNSGGGNLGNINGLNSTLGRLTNSINQLNNAINKFSNLTNQVYKPVAKPQTVLPFRQRFSPDLPDAAASSFLSQAGLKGMLDNQIDLYKKDNASIAKSLRVGSINDQQRVNLINRRIQNTEQIRLVEAQKKDIAQQNKLNPQIQQMITMGVGGFLVGDLMNGLNSYFQASGNKTGQVITNFGTNVGQGVAMGAAAGPMGMLVGGGFGVIQSSLQLFANNLKEAADAVLEWKEKGTLYSKLQEGYRNNVKDEKFDSDVERLLKGNNKSSLQYLLQTENGIISTVRNRLNNTDVNALTNEGKAIQEKLSTFDQIVGNDVSLEDKERQIEINTLLAQYAEDLKTLQNSTAKRTKILQAIQKLEENELTIKEKQKQDRINLSKNRNTANNLFRELGLFDESERNTKLVKTGTVEDITAAINSYKNKASNARSKYEEMLSLARSATSLSDSQRYLKNAGEWNNQWKFYSNEYSKLQNGLPNPNDEILKRLQTALSKLTAPNLDNVNSLASQGVMINRADDASREKSIEDYQREQTDLQRQIKEILNTKSFESVIS